MAALVDTPVLPPFLYRYRKITDKLLGQEIAAIKEQYLWCSMYREMNDPMEGFYEPTSRLQKDTNYRKTVRQMLNSKLTFGICCFSDTKDNELMWAHYATNNAGICVAYRSTLLIEGLPDGVHLARVSYGPTPPAINRVDTANIDGAALKILSHKKSNWVYEREWRVLGPLHRVDISSRGCVREVYLSSLMNSEHRMQILNALKGLKIKIFEMRVHQYVHTWREVK
jgi:hypothetical protein